MPVAVLLPDGMLRLDGLVVRAAIGRGGRRADKQEGDGATPVAELPLRRVLYRADRGPPPVCSVPIEPISRDDGWCDDPDDPEYNRMIRLPHPARHETLWRPDSIYDLVGVLGWNDRPVIPGRGSAIFLHVARPDGAPTEGCIALALGDLRTVLAAGLSGVQVLP